MSLKDLRLPCEFQKNRMNGSDLRAVWKIEPILTILSLSIIAMSWNFANSHCFISSIRRQKQFFNISSRSWDSSSGRIQDRRKNRAKKTRFQLLKQILKFCLNYLMGAVKQCLFAKFQLLAMTDKLKIVEIGSIFHIALRDEPFIRFFWNSQGRRRSLRLI